ncbi:MAG: hypothetical protein ACR2HV_07180 [Acidimicrobiales bacterium]
MVLEPTRNAWVPLAAWLQARGPKVVMVPPDQSADLRDYCNKHTKTDRLDSRIRPSAPAAPRRAALHRPPGPGRAAFASRAPSLEPGQAPHRHRPPPRCAD